MDDQTTTDVPVTDTGADTALPDQAEQTTAVTDDSDQSANEATTSEGEADASVPETDDKLQRYAESHGIELDSPSAIKAARIAMNNQAEYQRTRQKASQLEKSMVDSGDDYAEQVAQATGQDPELLKRVQRMEIRDSIRDFYDQVPTAREFDDQIKEKILSSGISGSPEAVLKAAWAMVQADDADSLKSEGAKNALNNLASKQRAAAPTGSAVSSAPSNNAITRAQMQEHLQRGDVAWFEKNQQKINQLVADGKLQ